MHSTSRAPVLSATLRRDSCWITWHAPGSQRRASASASTSGGSPSRAPGRRPWHRCSRRGRTGSSAAGRSSGRGGGGWSGRSGRRRSCPSGPRSRRRSAPCADRGPRWWLRLGPGLLRSLLGLLVVPVLSLFLVGLGHRLLVGLAGLQRLFALFVALFVALAPAAAQATPAGGRGLLRGRLGRDPELALSLDRQDPGDAAPGDPDQPVVLQLAGGVLEAQVEQLLLHLGQPGGQLRGVELPVLGAAVHDSPPACPSRRTNRQSIGSL